MVEDKPLNINLNRFQERVFTEVNLFDWHASLSAVEVSCKDGFSNKTLMVKTAIKCDKKNAAYLKKPSDVSIKMRLLKANILAIVWARMLTKIGIVLRGLSVNPCPCL